MDRKLHALVKLDVVTDVVRIDVRGSLNQESRTSLVHIIRRVRGMGISSHIRVDLSGAAFIESAALAGLRNDLNAVDGETLPGIDGEGVSLQLTAPATDGAAASINEQSLAITDVLTNGADGPPAADATGHGVLGGRLAGYSDDELLGASDSLFALLDTPEAFAGSDLLARYNDIGQEISRRHPADTVLPPAAREEAAG